MSVKPIEIPEQGDNESPAVEWVTTSRGKFWEVGPKDDALAVCVDYKDAYRIREMAAACKNVPNSLLEAGRYAKLLKFAVAVAPTLTLAQLRHIGTRTGRTGHLIQEFLEKLARDLDALNTLDKIEKLDEDETSGTEAGP